MKDPVPFREYLSVLKVIAETLATAKTRMQSTAMPSSSFLFKTPSFF
jgi:hypothetical protein